MDFCRDPALPFLEDKFHSKILAKINGIPFVPLLHECHLPQQLKTYLERHMHEIGDFVVKTNHGCGDVCIVTRIDENRWDVNNKELKIAGSAQEVADKLSTFMWKKLCCVHSPSEWAVNMIWPRRILVEAFVEFNNDYKVMVSGGEIQFTYCNMNRFGETGLAMGVFDEDWNFVGSPLKTIERHGKEQAETMLLQQFQRPAQLSRLYDYAKKLAPDNLAWQRVDFFMTASGEFMLGEITAYSAGGMPVLAMEEAAEIELARRMRGHAGILSDCASTYVMFIDKTPGETSSSQSALVKAYLAMALKGASQVIFREPDVLKIDHLDKLLLAQRQHPGKVIKSPTFFSLDKHFVMKRIGKILTA